jgi:hypothetical protein
MTISDQQFDPEKQYIARRRFVMSGHQYEMNDPVPVEAARDPDHFRRLFVSRLICLSVRANGAHHPVGVSAPPQEPAQPQHPASSAILPVVADPASGHPAPEAAASPEKEREILPGGTTTRYIEHTGRGWFKVMWDGTETKVRGAEAAQTVFGNLQAQDSVQKGETVFAKDAPEDAGGEPPREPAPWIEDGKEMADLP